MIEKILFLKPFLPRIEKLHHKFFPAWYAASSAKVFVNIEQEILLLPLLVNPASVAIDVGAHSGAYVWHLLKFTKMVEAFEPNPDMTKILKKAFASKINVHQIALSDEVYDAKMEIPYHQNTEKFLLGEAKILIKTQNLDESHGNRYISVQTKKLDDFSFKNVGFIKIDVEGHEMNVLEGGRNILITQKPNLLIEAEHRHRASAVSSLVNYLKSLGYTGFFLLKNQVYPISKFTEDMQDTSKIGSVMFGKNREYVNNFIFIHETSAGDFLERSRLYLS